jgi:dTDP-4-dehydrorhamnose 3,5-epimerase
MAELRMMAAPLITHSSIPDVFFFSPNVFEDERGYFFESYQKKYFEQQSVCIDFVQDNQSSSKKGTLRGLHYQIENTQAKLLRVISGEIYDVAVDIRKSSPTFGKYVSIILSSKNKTQIFIPEGFAHGFYVLSDSAEILYKASDYYNPKAERSILWSDPDLSIDWPIKPEIPLVISPKDKTALLLKDAELFK